MPVERIKWREICRTLSFFSLVFLFPWCFSCWGIPLSFRLFSPYFAGILRVWKVRKILDVFDGFQKTKEKKDREG